MKNSKSILYIVLSILIVWLSIQPPKIGSAYKSNMNDNNEMEQVYHLKEVLKQKNQELTEAIKNINAKPTVIYKTKYPKSITVYTKLDGIVTQHTVNRNNGLYILNINDTK